MSQFVTIAKSDKDFKSYMLGKVPNNQDLIAVPVKPFNLEAQKEQMTFQLIDKNQVKAPALSVLSIQLIRLKWLTLTLTPVVCTFFYLLSLGFEFNFLNIFIIGLTITFSHASIFTLNDFYDHLFGIDSVRPNGGSRVIQKAWIEASRVRAIGYLFLVLALIGGVYISYAYNWALLVYGAVGISIGWAYSYFSKFKRFIGLNAFIINMFMGPFLVLGFSWGVSKYVNISLVALGLMFGLMAYLCICFRHLENLYLSNSNIGKSIVEYLGFDKSRIFLLLLVLFLPIIYTFLCISLFQGVFSYALLFLALPAIFYTFILKSTYLLKSSMGSSIVSLRNSAATFHFLTGLSLALFFIFN